MSQHIKRAELLVASGELTLDDLPNLGILYSREMALLLILSNTSHWDDEIHGQIDPHLYKSLQRWLADQSLATYMGALFREIDVQKASTMLVGRLNMLALSKQEPEYVVIGNHTHETVGPRHLRLDNRKRQSLRDFLASNHLLHADYTIAERLFVNGRSMVSFEANFLGWIAFVLMRDAIDQNDVRAVASTALTKALPAAK
jgi:hypothetical protein